MCSSRPYIALLIHEPLTRVGGRTTHFHQDEILIEKLKTLMNISNIMADLDLNFNIN